MTVPIMKHKWFLNLINIIFLCFIIGAVLVLIRGVPSFALLLADEFAQASSASDFNWILGYSYIAYALTIDIFFVGVFILMAVGIYRHPSGKHWVSTFFALTLIALAVSESLIGNRISSLNKFGQPLGEHLGHITDFMQMFLSISVVIMLFTFPNGKFVPRWTRIIGIIWVEVVGLWYFFPNNPFNWVYGFTYNKTQAASFLFSLVVIGFGISTQIYRWYRASGPIERQQTRWVIIGALFLLASGTLMFAPPHWGANGLLSKTIRISIAVILTMGFPICVGIAVRQHHLWDLDYAINRAIVWAVMTVIIVLVFAIIVGGIGGLLQAQSGLILSAIATALVAVIFQPVRLFVQKIANRIMFGFRDDPLLVITTLQEQPVSNEPMDVLLAPVPEKIMEILKVPYVAISVIEGDVLKVIVSKGISSRESVRFELKHSDGRLLGYLIVSPRELGEAFNSQDKIILQSVARQIAGFPQVILLNEALQQSREKLVMAREEERRRLQRDLHDGLGPRLAASVLNIDMARHQLHIDPDEADRELNGIKKEMSQLVDDIRWLIRNLRPPALDQLGLVRALEEFSTQYQNANLIDIQGPETLPKLPASVEVAAYRIAQEAVTNVVKHAKAQHCIITFKVVGQGLDLTVSDDGVGLPENYDKGLGLGTMQERAEELGGEYSLKRQDMKTVVHIWLPLRSEPDVER